MDAACEFEILKSLNDLNISLKNSSILYRDRGCRFKFKLRYIFFTQISAYIEIDRPTQMFCIYR